MIGVPSFSAEPKSLLMTALENSRLVPIDKKWVTNRVGAFPLSWQPRVGSEYVHIWEEKSYREANIRLRKLSEGMKLVGTGLLASSTDEVVKNYAESISKRLELDFGNSYHDNNTAEIDNFVNFWNTAETEFLDPEIEAARKELFRGMHEFIHKLALHSGYINGGPILSAVPDAYRNAWDWPEHIDVRIKELNEQSTECYNLHQQFIMLGRRKLKC